MEKDEKLRLQTIRQASIRYKHNRYVKRGTLDADLAEVMKKLAKDKMLRALSNVAYAKGDYEKEMGQGVLRKEALEGKNYD